MCGLHKSGLQYFSKCGCRYIADVALWIEPEDQESLGPLAERFAVSDVNGKPNHCLLPQKLPGLCFSSERWSSHGIKLQGAPKEYRRTVCMISWYVTPQA